MKAACLTGIRKIEIQDVPPPSIQSDTDVLLHVNAVGICGSDLQYYGTGKIGTDVVKFPFIIGHECVAEVVKTGEDVQKVKPGDRVVVDPAVTCGICDQCIQGRRNTCRNLLFLGCPGQMEGSLAEFIVMPEANCFPLGEGVDTRSAILAEPLSIGIYSICLLRKSPISSMAILGSGPIGLSVGLAAWDKGISEIFMTDKIDARLEAARKAGAVWTGNPDHSEIAASIHEVKPEGLDAVFECCGDQEALDQAVELLRPGGTLVIVGIPETDLITFDAHKLRRKEIAVQNVRRQNGCIPHAIDHIGRRMTDLDFMVTHSFSLKETQEAFDLVENYRDSVIKALVQP